MNQSGIKNVLIGVTSGIAAYKVINLIEILLENRINVDVICSKNAVNIFPVKKAENLLKKKVHTDLFPAGFDYQEILKKKSVEHIRLADNADVLIIIPATANCIGKIAHGIADDFLLTTVLAVRCPVLISPSMNPHMWENQAVTDNLGILKRRKYRIINPETGELACGYRGVGRLPEISRIATEVMSILKNRSSLKGKNIMVTAGATEENIDDVRIITNRGSGKMGAAIAEECTKRGANVLLIRSSSSVRPSTDIREKIFRTHHDLLCLIKDNIETYDILFHSASVSDYRPEKHQRGKIDSNTPVVLTLHPTEKIIDSVKAWNPKSFLIGFKAVWKKSDKSIFHIASQKLAESKADYIVANDVGRKGIGFTSEDNEVYVVSKSGLRMKIPKTSKHKIAGKLIELIFQKV